MQDWVVEELRTSDLGDRRLDKRLVQLADKASRKPTLSIPAGCEGWAETIAAYRFFDNGKVTFEKILEPHKASTLERIQSREVVLALQDTTELDLTAPNRQVKGAGPMNYDARWGFFVHPMLAATPDGVPLGIVGAEIWARDPEQFSRNQRNKKTREKKRKQRSIENKESHRWLKGYLQACDVQAQSPGVQIVSVSDSEADIFESFAASTREDVPQKADFIVRGCQNRALAEKDSGENSKLLDELASSKILGKVELEVSKNESKTDDGRKRRQPRSARRTTASIQARRLTLRAPYRKGEKLPNLEINVVLVREIDPPEDEPPVEWLLLTSLPIGSMEEVCKVVEYYCIRWQIEIYFRVLKSGCKAEDRQLETADRYKPCLALYMIVAWRVMYMMMLGRKCPEMPCDSVLSEDEWKAVYTIVKGKEPPSETPNLQEMVYMIASLGGHLGRKSDGPPGPKTMWIGMQRMMDFARAWRAFRPRA